MNGLSKLITILNIGLVRRKTAVRIQYSDFNKAVVLKLIELGYLYGLEISKNNNRSVFINLFLKQNRNINNWCLKLISTPRRMVFVSCSDLLTKWRGAVLLLSTVYGVMSRDEALSNKCGGLLLFVIR